MERVRGGEKMNSNKGVVCACAEEDVDFFCLGGVWRIAGGENEYDKSVVSTCVSMVSKGASWVVCGVASDSGDDGCFGGLLLDDVGGESVLIIGSDNAVADGLLLAVEAGSFTLGWGLGDWNVQRDNALK